MQVFWRWICTVELLFCWDLHFGLARIQCVLSSVRHGTDLLGKQCVQFTIETHPNPYPQSTHRIFLGPFPDHCRSQHESLMKQSESLTKPTRFSTSKVIRSLIETYPKPYRSPYGSISKPTRVHIETQWNPHRSQHESLSKHI